MGRLRDVGRWVITFLALGSLAFSASVLMGVVWRYHWTLWLVLGIAAGLTSVLPRLRDSGAGTPSSLILAYGSGFLWLYLVSERVVPARETLYSLTQVAQAVLPVVGGLGALLFFVWLKMAKPPARVVAGWLAAACVLGLGIAFFSSSAGSSDSMLEFAMRTFHWSRERAETMVFYTRKGIHFGFYGLLSWVTFRAALAGGLKPWAALAFALAWTLPHAGFDELRQSGSTLRSASVADFGLDALGALVVGGLAAFRRRR